MSYNIYLLFFFVKAVHFFIETIILNGKRLVTNKERATPLCYRTLKLQPDSQLQIFVPELTALYTPQDLIDYFRARYQEPVYIEK